MLTRFDDLPLHQASHPVAQVNTSDRNFYDRYYFNCHDLAGETFLVVALGIYPNLGVTDAFATCVQRNTRQLIVRASRVLHDRAEMAVGPIGVEVLEGLRSLRIWCEPNDWGLDFDLTFEGVTFPFEEPHFLRHSGNRVVMDYTRLTQCGRWAGRLVVDGEQHQVTHDGWRGARDRSWGIRPVGEPELRAAPPRDGPRGFFWNWAPIQFDTFCLMYTVSEDHDGSRWHEAAARLLPYGQSQPSEPLTVLRHDLRLKPGTRTFDGGNVVLRDRAGRELTAEFRPLSLLHMAGAGYSYGGNLWRHGQFHGDIEVQGEAWDIRDADLLRRVAGQSETVCEVTLDGEVGYGIFEFILFGLYEPYGFKSFADVAS
jgi:hypothetical protein